MAQLFERPFHANRGLVMRALHVFELGEDLLRFFVLPPG
jgi:hypothetical protein